MKVHNTSVNLIFMLALSAIIFLCWFNLRCNAAAALRNEMDMRALLELKSYITEDYFATLDSWNGSSHFCHWPGVKCGLKHQRVTHLDLKGKRLAGSISPHIGNLSFLKSLDLSDNSFRGEIPQGVSNLFRLQNLNMSYNFLGGEMPRNLSQCSKLVTLALDHNSLVGQIPSELGSLSELTKLHLGSNDLSGSFPASFGNLTYLQELGLSYNQLKGELPDSVSRMRSLTLIDLSVNRLSGAFPPPLYNLSSLKRIGLSYNYFSGNLRSNIGVAFPKAEKINWGMNLFTGTFPDSFANASNLQILDLPGNNFTGNVPASLGNVQNLRWLNVNGNQLGSDEPDNMNFISSLTNCSNLQYLLLAHNHFGGMFPNSVTNLSTQLMGLHMGQNRIQGNIPKEISNLVNLNVLYLQENRLTGSIPASIGILSNLGTLDLDSNRLTGEIPSSIGNITRLLYLYLSGNALNGTVPPSLGNCKQLLRLYIGENNLSGTMPGKLLSLSSLAHVNLSYNSFMGSLPMEIGDLKNIAGFDLSYNNFSGMIPSTIGKCLVLESLYMQDNSFEGAIPYLADLQNLRELDLSKNNLSGEIPPWTLNLSSLLYLNLSHNNLEGEVPIQGIFSNATALEVEGNPKLCGGIQEFDLPPCLNQENHRTKRKHLTPLLTVIISVISVAAVACFLISVFFIKRSRKRRDATSTFGHLTFPMITYKELHDATNGFSSDKLLGSGSFGTVYKGILRSSNENPVAVKVLNLQRHGASKSFTAECQALRNIRHRNLVKVITACSSIDYKGNNFKAIVYQFMENGSLEEWLHQESEGQIQCNSLNILQRLNIAIDVASALHYLHHQCEIPVAHCDLKPSNILLDDNMIAHVSDFGLARLMPSFSGESNLNQFSSLGIQGTIGYAPPEYGMGAEVAITGDLYSYGILLLEIFTGKMPTDKLFEDNMNLRLFVKLALPDRIMDIVDGSDLYGEMTGGNAYEIISSEQIKCVVNILQLGLACSAETPEERINMEHVHRELITIRDRFLK
ncbi:probable LRR receptor-like serine/threonine-protein kinase At3g47570 [Capsicum annuum]|uniref:probable LRR receptor-like serine/threonine-protein kinase At3g47570 n=1 Tax=Capsicum annuum TaxID=4072 RepID=UPI001FB0EB3F|nr:probable LRR receptor-like serine/threonine-protein kinase At3g47570 [Capsicum annuum]